MEESMVGVLKESDRPVALQLVKLRTALASFLVNAVSDNIPWKDMNEVLRKSCLIQLLSEAETEEQLRERLRTDFGIDSAVIVWREVDPESPAAKRAFEDHCLSGRLASKSGAMVTIQIGEDLF